MRMLVFQLVSEFERVKTHKKINKFFMVDGISI